MYSLFATYTLIPLIFSHFFAGFGESFIVRNGIGSFESIKVQLFLVLIVLSTIEIMIFRWRRFFRETTFSVVSALLIFSSLSFLTHPESLSTFLFGTGEKQHGMLLFASVFWMGYLLTFLEKKEMLVLARLTMSVGIFVAVVAIIEGVFRYNIFTQSPFVIDGSWKDIRSTATLGNPNYVAGYLLMLMPICFYGFGVWEKSLALCLFFLGILMTKSVIGLTLASLFLLFVLFKSVIKKKDLFLLFAGVSVCLLACGLFFFIDHEKWLSFFGRVVLIKETFLASFRDQLQFLFGGGPNSIMSFYSFFPRPADIRAYFPDGMIIDSSHNIFIDILARFGVVGLVLFLVILFSGWKNREPHKRALLVVGLAFLFWNPAVLIHMLLIMYALSPEKK